MFTWGWAGTEVTETLMVFEVTEPHVLLLVTKKVPLELTDMDAAVLALLQTPPALPDRVTLPLPQIFVLPEAEIIEATG